MQVFKSNCVRQGSSPRQYSPQGLCHVSWCSCFNGAHVWTKLTCPQIGRRWQCRVTMNVCPAGFSSISYWLQSKLSSFTSVFPVLLWFTSVQVGVLGRAWSAHKNTVFGVVVLHFFAQRTFTYYKTREYVPIVLWADSRILQTLLCFVLYMWLAPPVPLRSKLKLIQ